jgi:hypothetical protein
MALNHKLTALLRGRTITGTVQQGNILEITFENGSTMKVKISPGSVYFQISGRRKIVNVHEEDAQLDLDCEDGTTVSVVVIENGSSVSLRDKTNAVEYVG